MDMHFSLDISKDQLLTMAGLVEKAVASSIRALIESQPLIAQDVIDNDKTIRTSIWRERCLPEMKMSMISIF